MEEAIYTYKKSIEKKNEPYTQRKTVPNINEFIALRGQGKIPITDFLPLVRILKILSPYVEIKKTYH
jgi:hypothetical protein